MHIINTERTVYGLLVNNIFNRIRRCYVRDKKTKQFKQDVPFRHRGRKGCHLVIFVNPLYIDRETEEFCYVPVGGEFKLGEIQPIYSRTYIDTILRMP